MKLVAVLTLFSFLHACSVRTLREVPTERVNDINEKNIIVVHAGEQIYRIIETKIKDGKLCGLTYKYTKSKKSDQLYNELHLYINPIVEFKHELHQNVEISLSDITKAEVYKFNGWKLLGNVAIVTSSVFVVCVLAIIVVMNNIDYNAAG